MELQQGPAGTEMSDPSLKPSKTKNQQGEGGDQGQGNSTVLRWVTDPTACSQPPLLPPGCGIFFFNFLLPALKPS